MSITLVSVLVAVFIGGIEVLELIGDKLHLSGAFWSAMARLGEHFGMIGYLIVGLFIVSWMVSWGIYKWYRFDELEPVSMS